MRLRILLIFVTLLAGCSTPADQTVNSTGSPHPSPIDPRVEELHSAMPRIEPFFAPMDQPGPDDWLASFHEDGQTFDEWLQGDPTLPTNERQKIYILPLGQFTDGHLKVITITAGYLAAFYGLPVELMKQQPLNAEFPNVRHNQMMQTRQVKTGYILDKVLVPMLPTDAAALIAFTDQDLFPDETMNYVFGQATLDKRVGVWSLYRLREASFERFVRRTIKIATHETGHMFSMKHCTKYECVMSGSNQLNETDRRPIDACPECMAKVCWLSHQEPAARYKRLADFCRKIGLEADAVEFDKKEAAVSK